MKSGAVESSRREEQEERRSEQRHSRETECSEARHRSRRTDVSGDTRQVETRRSTVTRCETSVPATRQEKERTEDQEHFITYAQIKDSGMILKEDILILQPSTRPFKVLARYFSRSTHQLNLLLCDWKDSDGKLQRSWFFEFSVDPELQIRFDLEYQFNHFESWLLTLYNRPLCDGLELAREKDGTVSAGTNLPSIPKVLLLPYVKDTTELFQEHGFTILIAMIGRLLMRPMQGQVEGVFSPEQFWDAVSPRVPRLAKNLGSVSKCVSSRIGRQSQRNSKNGLSGIRRLCF